MSSHSLQLFSLNKGIAILCFSLFLGVTAVLARGNNNQTNNKVIDSKSYLSLGRTTFAASPENVLIPMPLGDLDMATKKVQSTRDHFQELASIESRNIEILKSALKFNGIAKSKNNVVAMIQTVKGNKIYKVGDSMGNGFVIKDISAENTTVDISNGLKNYRLSFKSLTK